MSIHAYKRTKTNILTNRILNLARQKIELVEQRDQLQKTIRNYRIALGVSAMLNGLTLFGAGLWVILR